MSSPRDRIRKRPVSFGNPSLGTYHGYVYTTNERRRTMPEATATVIEGALATERLVAMVDVPPEQVPEGVLNLARPHRPFLDHVRIVIADPCRDDEDEEDDLEAKNHAAAALNESSFSSAFSRTYLVLFEFKTQDAADLFVEYLHGQPYTCLDEREVCSIYHVIGLQGEDNVSLMSPFFAPSAKHVSDGCLEIVPSTDSSSEEDVIKPSAHLHHTDDYNCAVCLEHMFEKERTSILTTVCNHSFHMDCLLQWQDSPCPVCRYDHSGLNEALSQCHVCGKTEHNFVCLICGVVSCGGGDGPTPFRTPQVDACRPRHDHPSQLTQTCHARQHYDETLHAYALDTESQHVWDFAGQGYVHRLLQNKDDGKLVEVSDPSNTSAERSLTPGLSDTQEEQVVHRKLEGFASQYYTLLKSQLEQQRIYYEGRLEEIRREHERAQPPRKVSADLIAALKRERNQLAKRLETTRQKCTKVRNDAAFLANMNESLQENKQALRLEIANAQQQRVESKQMFEQLLPPLQEKVTILMLQLESNEDGGGKPSPTEAARNDDESGG